MPTEDNQADDSVAIPVRVNRPTPAPPAPSEPVTEQPAQKAPEAHSFDAPEPIAVNRVAPATGDSSLTTPEAAATPEPEPVKPMEEDRLDLATPIGELAQPAEPKPEPELQPMPESFTAPAPAAEAQPVVAAAPAAPQIRKHPKLAMSKAVVAIIILFLLGGLGFAGYRFLPGLFAGMDLKPYENQNLRFAINQPEGWKSAVIDQPQIKQVVFREPGESEENSPVAQMVVRFDHNEEMADVSQDDFFKSIEETITSTLESQSGAEGLERAELTGKERADYGGKPALRLSFKVNNYDNTSGEEGFGEVLFIYIDGKTSYTIALEGHESDKGLSRSAKNILKSFRII